jgi:integrase
MLTDARLRRAQPKGAALSDGQVRGLYFFPGSEEGRGKWILRYKSPTTGKRRDMGLGMYPEVSLVGARAAAASARQMINVRQDPIDARNNANLQMKTVPTFEQAARLAHAELKPGFKNAKHADQWVNTLEDYVFPALGARPVDILTAADFANALRQIWLTKSETASRVKQRCDKVMNWCAAHGFIVASPVSVIDHLLPAQPGKRERVVHHPAMPWRDLPGFFQSEFREKPSSSTRLMLELLILTAARSGEVRGMCWNEIDLQKRIWIVPAERMKAKVAHRVPLTPRACEILTDLHTKDRDALVFQTRRGTAFSDMALTKLLRDTGAQSDILGRIATAHGFRSSFRDWASENGCPRDLAEKALAHTIKSATEAAYHRTDLLEQRRAMMQAWETHCATSKN